MKPKPNKRGRPRNTDSPKTAEADSAIARTVYALACWGFPLRSRDDRAGVFELVGAQALRVLGRADHEKKALGPDRVEQIFEGWFKAEQAHRAQHGLWPLQARWRYTKNSLHERCPNKMMTTDELAAHLLKNGGEWAGPQGLMASGDLVLSDKARAKLGPMPRLVFRTADEFNEENGVEK